MTIAFSQVTTRTIQLKVSPQFPRLVSGINGVSVTTKNADTFIGIDLSTVPISLTVARQALAVFDPSTGSYFLVPITTVAPPPVIPPSTSVPNDLGNWFNGLPYQGVKNGAAPTGGVTYWFNGTPMKVFK
jgi:hypothetical protein